MPIIWTAINENLTGAGAIPLAIDPGLCRETLGHSTRSAYARAYGAYSWATLGPHDQQDAIQSACREIMASKRTGLEGLTGPDLLARWHVCFRDSCKSAFGRIFRDRLPVHVPDDPEADLWEILPGAAYGSAYMDTINHRAAEAQERALFALDHDTGHLARLLWAHDGLTLAPVIREHSEAMRAAGRPVSDTRIYQRLEIIRTAIKKAYFREGN